MADPRYRPRDFCVPPELFGKIPLHRSYWRPPPIPNVDELRLADRDRREAEQRVFMHAAQMQHAYAVKIRQLMKSKKLTLAGYAELTGRDSGKRIGAFLRGEVVMRFDDLAWAEQVLGNVGEMVHRDQIIERRRGQALEVEISQRIRSEWEDTRAARAPRTPASRS